MKTRALYTFLIITTLLCICFREAYGQSMHFSQYYNAPLLLNPANTALLPDDDYRVGVNYRNQWSSIPVPYNTISAFSDFKIGGNSDYGNNNWLGLGLALFNDKAGDGNLSLTSVNGDIAYHLHFSSVSMLSAGLQGGFVQRSVNYDNLTFDTQWDGFNFDKNSPNGERGGVAKTTYYTVGAGLNFSYFPNDNVYIKLGGSLANINQPKESFYNMSNTIGLRPVGDLDVLFKVSDNWIVNPSIYYMEQQGASELVYGSLFKVLMGARREAGAQFIFGFYNRWNDAVIGVTGFEWSGLQVMASYDATISGLSPYNHTDGAVEFSIIYHGPYIRGVRGHRTYNCPRFF